MIEFRVLGPLEAIRDGARLPLPSVRQRALVTRLLLSRGRVVPADALVEAVWAEEPPHRARHALQAQVSRLRPLLGADVLVTEPPGYLLATGATTVDADEFEAAAARAATLLPTDPAAAASALERVLRWWRGPAYAEFAATFARAAAARLEEQRLGAREHLAEALLASDGADRAIQELRGLVAEHPLRERPHGLLMRAYHAADRQADAVDVFQRLRRRLGEELGLDPSPQLQQEYARVLRQELPAPARAEAELAPAGPPAAAPPAPVAAPTTSFVGRGHELARLGELVDRGRIVTLVGPGGVGKTRLAQELASRRTGGAVWWVDLAVAQEPDDVPYRLVDAFGLPQPADRAVEDFLVDALRSAHGLLVADNCEHVIARAAEILARIAAGCPGVVVLATSREPLAIDGERLLPVAPLPEPAGTGPALREQPAVALFADRLVAAGALELQPDEVDAVAAICRQVGGLPLAIELAAARARSLGIDTVAQRPPLQLLTTGRRDDPARHQSLRAVLDWSHHLLGPEEGVLFRRLAAFGGWFSLDDVEQVCADGMLTSGAIATALAGLVDKSIVAGPDHGRHRLLAPTRAYAAEQLAAHGEERWLGQAHARHFVGVAERAAAGLRTAEESRWVAILTDRIDELRTAHHWACANDADLAVRLAAALRVYATYHMRFELQDWAAVAAELPGARQHPLRAVALASAASGAWARGEFDTAEQLARRGLAAAGDNAGDNAGDGHLAAPAMLVLGDVALLAGHFSRAVEAYQQAAALAGNRDPHVRCEALGGQALVASHHGGQATAHRLAATAEEYADRVGAPGLRAMTRYFAGEIRLATDPAAARELLAQSRRLAAEAGALLVVGFATLSTVSLRARAAADPAEACAAYREAIEHWRRVGNRAQQWLTLRNLVPALVRAGQHELACLVHGALQSAPVRLPADVTLPETAAQAACERGGRTSMEDLVATVLDTIGTAPAAQAGSSR